jgi:hypothetical protein
MLTTRTVHYQHEFVVGVAEMQVSRITLPPPVGIIGVSKIIAANSGHATIR